MKFSKSTLHVTYHRYFFGNPVFQKLLFGVSIFVALVLSITSCKKDEEEFVMLKLTTFANPVVNIGDTLVIYGEGLGVYATDHRVRFAGSEQDISATLVTKNTVSVVVPADATSGPVTISLLEETASTEAEVTVKPFIITDIVPGSGWVGDTVAILGANFVADSTFYNNMIHIGLVPFNVQNIISASESVLLVTIPGGALSSSIRVGTAHGPKSFTIRPAEIMSFSPERGGIGTEVTIKGRGFSTLADQNNIYFGTSNFVKPDFSNGREMIVKVPPTAQTGKIRVQVAGTNINSNKIFTINLSIASIRPESASPGDEITITGAGFEKSASKNKILFGEKEVEATEISSSGLQLKVTIPADIPEGETQVTVKTTEFTSNTITYQVTSKDAPVIQSVEPAIADIGSLIILKGKNFGSNPAVSLTTATDNEIAVSGTTVNEEGTELRFTIPNGVTEGKLKVMVKNTQNNQMGLASLTIKFTTDPFITSITPTGGARPGETITINGKNFNAQGKNIVLIGGKTVTATTISANQLTALVPEGTFSGNTTISVRADGKPSNTIVNYRIKSINAPSIVSIAPANASPGEEVTITARFVSVSDVKVNFGDKEASIANINYFNNDGEGPTDFTTFIIKTKVPLSLEPGPVNVIVIYQEEVTSPVAFTVTSQFVYNPVVFYWSDGRELIRGVLQSNGTINNIKGTGVLSIGFVKNIIIDSLDKKIYYGQATDVGGDPGDSESQTAKLITSANFDGSQSHDVVTETNKALESYGIFDMVLSPDKDPVTGKKIIYYSGYLALKAPLPAVNFFNKVFVDGTGKEQVLTNNNLSPSEMSLLLQEGGKIYFRTDGGVYSVTTSGGSPVQVFANDEIDNAAIQDMRFYAPDNKLYLLTTKGIYSYDLLAKNIEIIFTFTNAEYSLGSTSLAIDPNDGGMAFWTAQKSGSSTYSIFATGLKGSYKGQNKQLSNTFSSIRGLAVSTPDAKGAGLRTGSRPPLQIRLR